MDDNKGGLWGCMVCANKSIKGDWLHTGKAYCTIQNKEINVVKNKPCNNYKDGICTKL